MLKQTLATLFLCLCFGAFSCTDGSGGIFAGGDTLPPPNGNGDTSGPGGPIGGGSGAPVSNPNAPTGGGLADDLRPNGGPNDPPEPVPEPMTMLLFGSGLAGVAYRFRRRRERKASKA